MILISNPDKSQWQEILKRPVMNTENLFDTVRSVIDRVKEEGDRAVRDYEEKFDKVVLASLAVSEEEQQEAENLVSEDLKAAIRLAKQNIETFHAAQRFEGKKVQTQPGVTCWHGRHPEPETGTHRPAQCSGKRVRHSQCRTERGSNVPAEALYRGPSTSCDGNR